MTGIQVLEQRKAAAIEAAAEAIRGTKQDTPRLDEVLAEPLIADEHRLTALVAELAEVVARHERAFNHAIDQVLAAQDGRIEKLEKGAAKKG